MIRSKLIYAALLVILFLFLILYRGALSLQLLVFAILFPLILRVLLRLSARRITVRLSARTRQARRGESFDWLLRLENPTRIPAVRALVLLEYRSSFTGLPQQLEVEMPVRSNNIQQVHLTFHAATSGMMTAELKSVRFFDPLLLFSVRRKLRGSVQVIVQPEPCVVQDWLPMLPETDDSPEYSKEKPGDDPSEIFDLHSYREGDAISRIHWKLSSKLDELMVKEFSLPLAGQHLLVPYYCTMTEQPEAAIRLDAMLGLMSGAESILSEAGFSASLILLQQMTAVPVMDFEDYSDALTLLLRSDPQPKEQTEALTGKVFRLHETEHPHDSLLIFLPYPDPTVLSQLAGMQHSERVTVFAVFSEGDELPPDMLLPFPLIRGEMSQMLPDWELKLLPAKPVQMRVPEGGAATA